MITGINQSRMLTKHILCRYKCKFDVRKCNFNQKWNNDRYLCKCKNLEQHHACKKEYIWNPSTCSCENGEYLGSSSSIDDSMIMCNEILNAADSVSTDGSANVMSTASTNFY